MKITTVGKETFLYNFITLKTYILINQMNSYKLAIHSGSLKLKKSLTVYINLYISIHTLLTKQCTNISL